MEIQDVHIHKTDRHTQREKMNVGIVRYPWGWEQRMQVTLTPG